MVLVFKSVKYGNDKFASADSRSMGKVIDFEA